MAKKKNGGNSYASIFEFIDRNSRKGTPAQRQARQNQYVRRQARTPVFRNDVEKKVYNTAHKAYRHAVSAIRNAERKNVNSPEYKYRQKLMNRNDTASKIGRGIIRKLSKSSIGSGVLGATHGLASGVTLNAGDFAAKAAGYKDYDDYHRAHTKYHALTKKQEEKLKSSKAYKVGETVGDIASYFVGYGGAAKALGKGAEKLVGKKLVAKGIESAAESGAKALGKGAVKRAAERGAVKTAERAAEKGAVRTAERTAVKSAGKAFSRNSGKIGEKVVGKAIARTAKADVRKELKAAAEAAGKKMSRKELSEQAAKKIAKMSGSEVRKYTKGASERIAKNVAKDVLGDVTVGAVMDTSHELKNGVKPIKEGNDGKLYVNGRFVRDMAGNAATNLVVGGAMDTVPGMVGGLRGSKGSTKLVRRLGADGKVHTVKVAADEGEEALTHAKESAKYLELGKSGAETKSRNKLARKIAEREEREAVNKYSDFQKSKKKDFDRLEELRKRASGEGVSAGENGKLKASEAQKEYDNLRNRLMAERDRAVANTERNRQRQKFAQIPANKENVKQVVHSQESASKMLHDENFVKYMKDNGITASTMNERAVKNGTKPIEEFRKVRDEYNAKLSEKADIAPEKAVKETAGDIKASSDNIKVAAAKVEKPKYSVSKAVDDNLSDLARGYMSENKLKADDVWKRPSGWTDEDYADAVSEKIESRLLSDAKNNPDKLDELATRYESLGKADREADRFVPENKVAAENVSGSVMRSSETAEQVKARKERENDITFGKGLPQDNEELRRTIEKSEAGEAFREPGEEAKILTELNDSNLTAKEKISEYLNGFQKRWINSSIGVERIAEKYNDRTLAGLWDNIRRRAGRTEQLVNGDGFYRITGDGKTERVGDSLAQILMPEFKKGEEYYDELNEYLFRSHDVQRSLYNKPVFTNPLDEKAEKIKLAKQFGEKPKPVKGKGLQFSDKVNEAFNDVLREKSEQSKQIADELLKKHPEFKEVQDKIRQYIHNVNQLKVDSGVMTKEQMETLEKRYPNYVPTYRADYYMQRNGMTSRGGNIKASAGIRAAKGSSKDIAPLQLQLAAFTSRSVNASAYNNFANRLLSDFNSKRIIKDIEPIDVSKVIDDTEVVEKAVDGIGKNKQNNPFAVRLKDVVDVNGKDYTMTAIQGNNAYRFVIDKDVFDAVKALEEPINDIKALNRMNNTFRNLVTTLNPFFPIRNGARDFLDAAAYSKYGTGSFLKNFPKAWGLMVKDADIWKAYKNLSGVGNTIRNVSEDISVKGYKKYEGVKGRVAWAARSLTDRVEVLNEIVEQGPRFAEFLTTLEKEGNNPDSIVKALYNANEITENFNRSGTLGKWLNANGATFLNAGIQDVARTAKLIKQGKVGKLLYNAALFGIAPSLINEALCGDDPNYQRIRTQDKDVNFYIPTGDGKFLKIPKGRVTGTIATVPQRVMRELMGNTDKSETMLQGVLGTAKNQVSFNNPLKNNLYAPINDSKIANDKSQGETWYGTPVVSSALSGKPQDEQYDENTTELAKFLGKRFNKSPQKIDYILKQSTGVIGQTLPSIPGIGSVSKTGAGKLGSVANAFTNLVSSNFIADTATSNKRSGDFYNRLDELKQRSNSNKATQYDKMVYSFMYKQSGNLGAYNDQITKIERDKSLSASEKLAKIRVVRRKQTKETEKVISMERDYKKYYNQLKDKFSVNDYKDYANPEQQMKNKLNEAIERKVAISHGADPVEYDFSQLSKTQREGWGSAKKAGVSKSTFMKYKVESTGSGRTTISKAFSAIDAGAKNRKQASALITNGKGKISETTWNNAKELKKAGITSDNLKKYSKITHGLKDSAYAAKAYAAIKAGAKNYNQALAISGSNIYGTTWDSVVTAYNNGVSYKQVKYLYSDKVQKQMAKTASNGRPYRTKDLTVRWIENHYGNKPVSVKRTYYHMLKYRNWGEVY